MDAKSLENLFKPLGLLKKFSSANAANKEAIINLFTRVSSTGEDVLSGLKKPQVEAILDIAVKVSADDAKALLVDYVLAGKLPPRQLTLALAYFKKAREVVVADFERDCGVGVVVDTAEIVAVIEALLAEYSGDLEGKTVPQKKSFIWKVLGQNREKYLNFADDSVIKQELDKLLDAPPVSKTTRDSLLSEERFPPPEKNDKNTPENLAKHLTETSGRYILRFPPEPNGYLHIGHAKSMNLNYGYAKKKDGWCYMRFDDTNPETESPEYVASILENVKWMGHKWYEVTYASDYFDRLYECAVELIKRGKAFICHQTPEEIESSRETHTNSPFRDRDVETNLKLFEDMKNGLVEEGKATLRMKMDMQSTNSCMWDPVAYRVKKMPHHRTGDKWVIYPSYDFTHCLCDTFENITHSLCTLEFRMRRESYDWLVNALGLYVSYVFEFAKLNLTYTVLSKRRLIQLVHGNYVNGWDDPRIPTIDGLKRRGYSPQGINDFCDDIGVTTVNSTIPIEKLEHFVRADLDKSSRRIFAVFEPIKVTLRNWKGTVTSAVIPNVPSKPDFGTHTIPFTDTFYISSSDFKENDVADYFGLALDNPDKYVKLKAANVNIRIVEAKKNDSGQIIELIAEDDGGSKANAKLHPIHWVPVVEGKEPLTIEVREYDRLWLSPDAVQKYGKKDYLKDLNPDSLRTYTALIDPSVSDLKHYDRVQFERVGFYVVDPDSSGDKWVFNKTVGLKASTWCKKQDNKA